MNERDTLHLSDWFNAAVAVAVALGAGLTTWFVARRTGRRKEMRDRLEKLETGMSTINQKMASLDEQMAVVETNMEHIQRGIKEVKRSTEASTKLLQDLLFKLAK